MNNEYLDFAKELAYEAGEIMKKYFEAEEIGLEIKSDNTPVTLADKEINELVIEKVKKRFPGHGVIGEEGSYNLNAEKLWIVDPVDGTVDFTNKLPRFAFSIAFVQKGKLTVGLVYNPIANRMFYASIGQGAYENGKKLHLSDEMPEKIKLDVWIVGGIENSILVKSQLAEEANRLISSNPRVDSIEDWPIAYALSLVASGDFSATLSTIKTPWDVAAGSLIAAEAGAKITDLYGNQVERWDKEAKGIFAAPPAIHSFLLDAINPAIKENV